MIAHKSKLLMIRFSSNLALADPKLGYDVKIFRDKFISHNLLVWLHKPKLWWSQLHFFSNSNYSGLKALVLHQTKNFALLQILTSEFTLKQKIVIISQCDCTQVKAMTKPVAFFSNSSYSGLKAFVLHHDD